MYLRIADVWSWVFSVCRALLLEETSRPEEAIIRYNAAIKYRPSLISKMFYFLFFHVLVTKLPQSCVLRCSKVYLTGKIRSQLIWEPYNSDT